MKDETILLHGGQEPDKETGSRAVPIYQTTSYVFKDSKQAADLFALKEEGNIYTRIGNPTTAVLEKRIAELEGGVGALAVASGMAAISLAILNICQNGDEIVASNKLYGGTTTLFANTLPKFGIKVIFVDPDKPDNFKKAITAKTKAIYTESIGNPKLNVADLKALSKIAKAAGVPLILDNTTTPYILKPFEQGVDIIVYSATKFIGGHGNSIGGLIVDSGKFNWGNGKFPLISQPDPSYHGLNFLKEFGGAAYITKARVTLLRDLGPALSPFNAFLLLQGLETLHLRMPRHCENAAKVARFLKKHPKVDWVIYPDLGALVGFGVKGGLAAGKKFINNVKLLSHLANIGDAKTLVIHPASTTHQQLSEEERLASGVTPDFIRLSVGIEHVDDIISDIKQALDKV